MPPAVSTSRSAPECVPQPRLEVEVMLADQLDYVVGVDPHRDSHALAVVQVVSGAVLFEAAVAANSDGYANALNARRPARPWPTSVRGRRHRLLRCRPDALPDRSR